MNINKRSHRLSSYILTIIVVLTISAIVRANKPKFIFNNGEIVYSIPLFVAFAFGGLGLLVLIYSFFSFNPMKKILQIGGSFIVSLQYFFLIENLSQYPEVFRWYHGILLAPYVLFSGESYSTAGTVVTLVLPCIIILLSTLAIPLVWFYPDRCEKFFDLLEARMNTQTARK